MTIINFLEDTHFGLFVDYDAFIPDPYTGVLTMFDIWLNQYGVLDDMFIDFPEHITLATYPTNESDLETRGEEAITTEEEDEIIIGSHILVTLHAEDDIMSEEEDIYD